MGRNRFVTPETIRLELSDGDWIEVKKRLTFGEKLGMEDAAISQVTGSQVGNIVLHPNLAMWRMAKLTTWIVDWSLRDAEGKEVVMSRDALGALEQDTALEIEAALERHIQGQKTRKNSAMPGATRPEE